MIISDPFFEKTNKIPSTEKKVLERSVIGATSENSRLACCVKVTPQLNEMIVVVADNQSKGGDYFQGHDEDAF